MNSREQTLSLVLIGTVVLIAALGGGYMFVWQPLQTQRAAEAALNQEIDDLKAQARAQEATAKKLAVARVRSLPADVDMAKREYSIALARMVEAAGVPKGGYTILPKSVDNTARTVPEISKGKPIYTKVAHELVLKKVDMWMLKDFLEQYYRMGLLHQITAINIKKDDDASKKKDARNDLTVTLTTEAILVDGADNRRTLLPIPTAFAAIGGGALYKSMTTVSEAGRGVHPPLQVPILATAPRDYSLIVRKDPFNGPLVDPPKVPFQLAKISDVKVETDKSSWPVKVAVTGEGALGAKVTAIASGTLFAEGALKVDPKTFAIELPKTSATEGSATVSVIATSADGSKTEKTSFKVSLAEAPPPPVIDAGEDLSKVILLIGITPRSDGTAWARIVDNAHRYRYQIDATPKSISVRKEWTYGPDRPWRTDTDHDKLPAGVMELNASTKMTRTFKLIAVTGDGLVLADIKPGGAAKPEGMMMGGPAPRPAKQHANPLAALGGNMIVAVAPPKYYRWAVGQPLAEIKLLPDSEVKQILKTAATNGPVFDVAVGGP